MSIIMVSGAIANKPFNGGEAWVRLSWVRGLQQLGFHVLFVEQLPALDDYHSTPSELAGVRERQVRYFAQVMAQFGRGLSAALIDQSGKRIWGLAEQDVIALAREAVALVNISGHLEVERLKDQPKTRVYIDLDPGFTQFWHEQGNLNARLEGHHHYFSVGANIGAADCLIPTNGIIWHPVNQPVGLDDWPMASERADSLRFTTVGSWRGSFGPVHVGDRVFGQKVHEFRKFIAIPKLVESRFEIALDINPGEVNDLRLLQEHGWQLENPHRVAGDPLSFRRYVQESSAEFSVAQGMYVDSNSGWFSDRTVRYLASGKPALVQDTGFARRLPVGEGLIAFRTLAEAVAGAEWILRDYPRHVRAARQIAAQYFSADRVLRALLTEVNIPCPPRTVAHVKRMVV